MTPQQTEELATLWTASQRVVAAFIRTLVPDFSEADDILQRVAVVLVRKFAEYDGSRPFAAWAIGIAKWEVLAYRRERAMDRHVFFNEGLIDRIADSYRQISQERSPKREMLAKCFDRLDTRAREAIDLRYAKNLPTLEIAREMAMTDSAVRKLLSRARSALRDCVDRRLEESGDRS
jgi:RNA polymerase sigma-70 factor (ECF subfamily)